MRNVDPVVSVQANTGQTLFRPRAIALAISAAFGMPQLAQAQMPTGGVVLGGASQGVISTPTRTRW